MKVFSHLMFNFNCFHLKFVSVQCLNFLLPKETLNGGFTAWFILTVIWTYEPSLMFVLVAFEVLTAVVMKISIFWDVMSCSPLKVNRRFGGTCRLHLQGWRISQARNQHEAGGRQSSWLIGLVYFASLKMEATCSSKTSVNFQWTTQRRIAEDRRTL
jgi:hypothetical protein